MFNTIKTTQQPTRRNATGIRVHLLAASLTLGVAFTSAPIAYAGEEYGFCPTPDEAVTMITSEYPSSEVGPTDCPALCDTLVANCKKAADTAVKCEKAISAILGKIGFAQCQTDPTKRGSYCRAEKHDLGEETQRRCKEDKAKAFEACSDHVDKCITSCTTNS